jgi:hypothetical protein
VSTTGKWEELFGGGRKWRVAEELTGSVRVDGKYADGERKRGIAVTFARGEFEVPVGAAFASVLSTNLGRRGVVLQETSPDGSADIPGSVIAVGNGSVDKARREYSAVW